MNTEEKRIKVCDAWQMAASALSIRIEIPYLLKTADGEQIPYVAHLPDFGGPKGIVIDLYFRGDYELNERLKLAALSQGLFYSFINAEIYERYDEEVFKEALVDWGFFGNEDCRPNWLPKPTKKE
jgi:hypothetical protein